MKRVTAVRVSFRSMLSVILLLPAFLGPATALAQTASDIVGMGIAHDDHVYVWYRGGNVSSGMSDQLEFYRLTYSYTVAAATGSRTSKTTADIVGMGIACSNDHVYAWYGDGAASSGSSRDLDSHRTQYPYSLPSGKRPADIVGLGIASDDHVYAWYRDGTVSSGTSADLDKYRAPYKYTLAPGKTPADIAGMAIACSNDHVYVWYTDGTVSSGSSSNLDQHRSPYRYSLKLEPPETPTDARVTAPTASSLRLQWNDNSRWEEGFRISERRAGNVASTRRDDHDYTFRSLKPDTEYCYSVKAWNKAGESAPSKEACGITAKKKGYKQAAVFNCHSEKRKVYIWTRDAASGAEWTQRGSLSAQWSGSSCPAGAAPFEVTFIDGHVYELVVVDPELTACGGRNDPVYGACQRGRYQELHGDAGGATFPVTIN